MIIKLSNKDFFFTIQYKYGCFLYEQVLFLLFKNEQLIKLESFLERLRSDNLKYLLLTNSSYLKNLLKFKFYPLNSIILVIFVNDWNILQLWEYNTDIYIYAIIQTQQFFKNCKLIEQTNKCLINSSSIKFTKSFYIINTIWYHTINFAIEFFFKNHNFLISQFLFFFFVYFKLILYIKHILFQIIYLLNYKKLKQ